MKRSLLSIALLTLAVSSASAGGKSGEIIVAWNQVTVKATKTAGLNSNVCSSNSVLNHNNVCSSNSVLNHNNVCSNNNARQAGQTRKDKFSLNINNRKPRSRNTVGAFVFVPMHSYARCITAYNAVEDMATHNITPCKKGFKPTDAKTFRDKPAPIKNSVTVRPDFATLMI